MEIGISSHAYHWGIGYGGSVPRNPITPFDLLEKVVDLDVRVLQLCENICLQRYNTKLLRELRRRAEKKHVTLEIGVQEVDFSVLKKFLMIATVSGSRLLRVVLNTPTKHPTLNESVAIVNKLLPILKAENITLAVENHFHLSSEEIVKLVRAINSPLVGICLDTANSTGLLEEPLDTVRSLAPYAVSVHLKDYKIVQSLVGYRITGTPLGKGFLDIKSAISLLRQSIYDPNIILELWMEKSQNEEETLRIEETWVRESVKYIKKLLIDK